MISQKQRFELMAIERSLVYWQKVLDKKIPDWADYSVTDESRGGIKRKKLIRKEGFPLCHRFFLHKVGNDFDMCTECPIALTTGKIQCKGTPYQEFCRHQIEDHHTKLPFWNRCPECEYLIMGIINFIYKVGIIRHKKFFPQTFGLLTKKIQKIMDSKPREDKYLIKSIYDSHWNLKPTDSAKNLLQQHF